MAYRKTNPNGQNTKANSAPVVLASDQDALPLSTGASTSTKQDTGNTSLASIDGKITAVNTGAVVVSSSTLPTGAATSAKQPALGTAGTSSADVLTVQGRASMTPILTDASATTQPVSGTITANAGTNLNTSALALDSTLTSGSQKSVVRGGSKGTTTAADITSSASGANHQPIDVAIYDGSGNQVTSFGGGTQYAEGVTAGTATGTVSLGKNGTTVKALLTDSSGNLRVDLSQTAANTIAIKTDSSATTQPVSGAVTVSQATATNLKTQSETYQGGTAVGSVNPLQVSLANTVANATAVKTDSSATTQPISGTVTSNQGGTWTSTVTQATGTNLHTVIDSGTVTANAGTNLNTSALATSANLTAGTQKTQIVDGSGNVIASTGNALNVSGSFSSTPPADTALSTGTITAQDTGTSTATGANGQAIVTGTPTAGSFATFAVNSRTTLYVGASGTWTGNLMSEGSYDGGATWVAKAVKQTGTGYTANNFTANFEGEVNAANLTNFRVRSTITWTGSATVSTNQSSNLHSIYIANNLAIRDGTTQSITSTIKAASTAPIATDTALVMTLRDTAAISAATLPLPTGAATAAKQPAIGTAGAAATDVLSVQGVVGGVAQPVSGTVTANAGTNLNTSALALDATLTGGTQRTKLTDGTNNAAVKAASTAAVAADPAVVVAVSPNNTIPVSLATNTPTLQSGSTTAVTQATAANLNAQIVGSVASAATDAGNPVKIGGQARTTNPTAVTDAQRVNAIYDKLGKQVVVGSVRDLKADAALTLTSTTTETSLIAAIAATFNDVYGLIVTNTSAAACEVIFRDALAGTPRFSINVPAGDTRGFMLPESAAYKQATVNTAWTAQCGTSTASIKINAMYVKNI